MNAKNDFLSELIEPNRARVLRTIIFNENEQFTPLLASKRSGTTPAAAEVALRALEKMGVTKSARLPKSIVSGGKKKQISETIWFLNPEFKHLRALSAFVREISPVRYDQIIDSLRRSGKLSTVVLSGSFMGDMSRPADLLIAVDSLNERKLENAVKELEPVFGRELRYASFSTPEFRYRLTVQDRLLRDTLDFPHVVLLDRSHLL
jgi:NDP-sugar pyrophosphorylase family protein